MKISNNHDYNENYRKWQIVRDCVQDKVKERACRGATCVDGSGQHGYITRDPNASDGGYHAFAHRAVFKNYVGNTLATLIGSMFYRPYQLSGLEGSELPESIAYIEEDFTGSGVGYADSLKQRARDIASVGRGGVLVTVPSTAAGLSQAEIKRNRILAQAKYYKAEQITDWSTAVIGGVEKLNYVRLEEDYEKVVRDGKGFKREQYAIITEAYLDDDGLYSLIINDNNEEAEYQPRLGNGQRLDFIPFQFYGSENNKPDVDIAPLYKISEINIGLFNLDANLRQNIHYFAVPTASFSLNDNVSGEEFKQINGLKDGDAPSLGGTAYIGCDINLAQPSVDNVILTAMDKDVESMAQIGAQIITVGQNETAEAARIRKSSGMVSLSDIVDNLERGDRNVIRWMMMFNNASGQADEFELNLNRKFYDDKMSAQELQAKFTMVMAGKYPLQYLFNEMKEQGSGIPEEHTFQDMLELSGSDVDGAPINPDEGGTDESL